MTTLAVRSAIERWPLREPFAIAREVMHDVPVLVVTLTDDAGHVGRAEAAGVDYDGETPESMAAQIAALQGRLHAGLSASELAAWLPPGGARNALDCALLDFQAKASGIPVWQALGLCRPVPVTTAVTLGLGDPGRLARRVAALGDAVLIKVKVDATAPVETVRQVRDAAPRARLIVDANESWSLATLERSLAALHSFGVELVEQPLRRGADAALASLRSPIPLAADESCTDRSSLDALEGCYAVVNVKLDKCGGLTEGLALVREARRRGFEVMVGNMCGSSLAMAPACLLAPMARWVDLDGPWLQVGDRHPPLRYDASTVHPPERELWG